MSPPLDHLAALLDYPEPDVLAQAERARGALAEWPAAAAELEAFAAHVAGCDPREVEELYTRTFDIMATCCLDVGYQLFGETYKRGLFLVKMRDACRRHGVDARTELPDHLPVVLRLLARLAPEDEPEELVREVLLPAVGKMLLPFHDAPNPYAGLLRAVDAVLRAVWPPATRVVPLLPVVYEGGDSRA